MCKIPALCGTALLCLVLTGTFAQPLVGRANKTLLPFVFDDNPTASNEIYQPDMLSQSPEAAAMVKNAALPVTLYSGMADVSVPVYDLKTRNLDVPISLSYNYNGFKPAEVASYVGLGWSVQGGGVITRIVKSRVDHPASSNSKSFTNTTSKIAMMDVYNIDWFKSELATQLIGYELEYKFFNEGDFGSLNQVEFNSKKIGGNIDFWGLGWMGIFVWDYRKEVQLLNLLIKPDQEEEKKLAINELKKLLL